MTDVRRTLEREIDGIPAAEFGLEAVARRRDRRRRNRRIGSGALGAAIALLGIVAIGRVMTTSPEQPAGVPRDRLVFVSPGHGGEEDRLMASTTDGADLVQLADIHAEYPEWSPDGTSVAFDDGRNLIGSPFTMPNGQIYVVAADGSDLRRVSPDGGFSAPSWSPDGGRLAVAAARPGEASGISWMDVATAELTPVTSNPFGQWDGEPVVSPDGGTIAFTRIRELEVSDATRHLAALFVVNADGSGLRRLTSWASDAAAPAWSPDGSRIAFNTDDHFDPARSQRIVVIDADGSDARTLVRSGPNEGSYWPTWSPDGARIVFTRADLQLVVPSQLLVVPSRGGDAVPFLSEPELNQADWATLP
ncbi:MAG TPA: hypothetical protein VE032_05130 [Actinomycetota bacterium]|nr:hypothetical protein [Actinomycetota bacterium]